VIPPGLFRLGPHLRRRRGSRSARIFRDQGHEAADSNVDEHTGEGQRSNGVTYSLTTVNGEPAVQVKLDEAWLRDAARSFSAQ
jgi:hypothetical protein